MGLLRRRLHDPRPQRLLDQVRREYELDAEVGEAWLAGGLGEHVDVTLGRQVVSGAAPRILRVLDVLNPLDNREPGRVDIEDIRRPASMLNVKGYAGDWSAALIAIPEIRFDSNPGRGQRLLPGHPRAARTAPAPFRGHRARRRAERRSSAAGTSRSTARGSGTTCRALDDVAGAAPRARPALDDRERRRTTRSGAGCSRPSSPISTARLHGAAENEPLRRAGRRRVLRAHSTRRSWSRWSSATCSARGARCAARPASRARTRRRSRCA